MPAGHAIHAVRPAEAAIVPAKQAVHCERPVDAAIVPARQAVHVTAVAPPPEYEPTGQSPFGALSKVVEQYLPAVQDVHAGDDAPPPEYEPAGQSPLTASLPPLHQLPIGHKLQPQDSIL